MGEKKIFVNELAEGQELSSPFLVLSLSRALSSRGGLYLNVELADKSGRLPAKVWDEAELLTPYLAEGSVVWLRGSVSSYRGSLQLVIRQARPLEAEEIKWADFLKSSPRPLEEMEAELTQTLEAIADADFRRLAKAALSHPETADKFRLFPAAKSLHHAHLHGLMEHSLSVARLARHTAASYPRLNGSLLLAGALLHDLGKIWEFSPPPLSDYSTLGRLKGHLVLGSEFLGRLAETLPQFPPEKLLLLQHLIVSHHGEPEFGAPVRPQLLEAVALHHLDNIDAKIEAIGSFLDAGTNAEGWSEYHRLFGSHFRRTPIFQAPEAGEEPEPEKPLPAEPDDEPEAEGQDQEPGLSGRLF